MSYDRRSFQVDSDNSAMIARTLKVNSIRLFKRHQTGGCVRRFPSLVLILLCLLGAAAQALGGAAFDEKAVADFYRGKTVRIIVGFSAGGGYDAYSRLIGRH